MSKIGFPLKYSSGMKQHVPLPIRIKPAQDEVAVQLRRLELKPVKATNKGISLPPELWTQIFKHLSSIDIVNLPFEITSKNIGEVDAAKRFSNVCISITRWSLSTLSRIASHPILKNHLSSITILVHRPRCVPNLEDDNFNRPVDGPPGWKDVSDYRQHRIARQTMIDQRHLRDIQLEKRIFAYTFARLQALKSLNIENLCNKIGDFPWKDYVFESNEDSEAEDGESSEPEKQFEVDEFYNSELNGRLLSALDQTPSKVETITFNGSLTRPMTREESALELNPSHLLQHVTAETLNSVSRGLKIH